MVILVWYSQLEVDFSCQSVLTFYLFDDISFHIQGQISAVCCKQLQPDLRNSNIWHHHWPALTKNTKPSANYPPVDFTFFRAKRYLFHHCWSSKVFNCLSNSYWKAHLWPMHMLTFHKSFSSPPYFCQGELVEKIGRSPQAAGGYINFESETDFGHFSIFWVGWHGLVRLTLAFTRA